MSYRKCQQSLSSLLSKDGQLVYCNDADGLLQKPRFTHNPEERRLFVDSSKFSLKAELLHIGNISPSIPIAHSVHVKETYKNVDLLLEAISDSKYGWKVCRDLKVIGLLVGMQSGCFLCEWDSQSKR